MTTNLVQTITQASDVSQLHTIADRVIGEICWKAALSYGDELMLHFGEQIPYTQPSMLGKKKGAWILGTRGTAWRLMHPTGITVTSDAAPKILKQAISQLEGITLISLKIDYPTLSLRISFDQEWQLTVIPSPNDDDFDLPYWELFTPNHQVLKVGPKASWSFVQSN